MAQRDSRLTMQASIHHRRQYRYYELVMAAFVVVLICSNLIGPAKIAQVTLPFLGVVTFGAGVLFFPISYVFGDILTEVYGYARARKVIWALRMHAIGADRDVDRANAAIGESDL